MKPQLFLLLALRDSYDALHRIDLGHGLHMSRNRVEKGLLAILLVLLFVGLLFMRLFRAGHDEIHRRIALIQDR